MKKLSSVLLSLMVFSLSGCASGSFNLQSLAAINIADLENARSEGVNKTFPLSYNDAFSAMTQKLKENKLTIFRSNIKEGYIVAIGFPKQETTTRVGIFFENLSEKSTKITLSSLSSSALEKAEIILFGGLSKDEVVIK